MDMSRVISSDTLGQDIKQMIRFSVNKWIRFPISVLSFWSAIALPALYIPLFLSGLANTNDLMIFLGLFGLHIIALIGGRQYSRRTDY